jgi:2-dehydro-3-deoxyphosphogluconate aldolase/(4S)-4-hydroxy-2-oxoglutarate aldolase
MQSAINVGAAYGVSPGLDLELIAEATKREFPFIPGVATASELLLAHNHGFQWVKAFPASELGPGWFAAIKGPFPEINLVATGGVTGHSAATFLNSGASVVGIGGGFGRPDELEVLRSLINSHSVEGISRSSDALSDWA